MKLSERCEYTGLKRMANSINDLINSYKARLYDIEHDCLPENEVLRKQYIRILLAGTDCKTIEEGKKYCEDQLILLDKQLDEIYSKMATYSKWSPTVRIEN